MTLLTPRRSSSKGCIIQGKTQRINPLRYLLCFSRQWYTCNAQCGRCIRASLPECHKSALITIKLPTFGAIVQELPPRYLLAIQHDHVCRANLHVQRKALVSETLLLPDSISAIGVPKKRAHNCERPFASSFAVPEFLCNKSIAYWIRYQQLRLDY